MRLFPLNFWTSSNISCRIPESYRFPMELCTLDYLMAKILVLHGPNLNLLGQREPGHYGNLKLQDVNARLQEVASENKVEMSVFQSNAEHELIEKVHNAQSDGVDFIVINPAAFTHTSVALRDAFSGVQIPFIEIHISNVHAREEFRQHSFFSDIAIGVICGLGVYGYEAAFRAAINYIETRN